MICAKRWRQYISQSRWHLWQAGSLTLINARGERMLACYDEPVVVVWEFWKMTRPQQEALRSEGINRHEWERSPLGGHSALFMHRGPEIGRLSACVQKSHDSDDKILFNNTFQRMLVLVGCVIFLFYINFKMKNIFAIAEKQDWEGECQKDKSEQKMFELFAAGIEDLYTKVLEPYIRKTPALLDAFAIRWW